MCADRGGNAPFGIQIKDVSRCKLGKKEKTTEVPLQVGSTEKSNRGELCAHGGTEEMFCPATAAAEAAVKERVQIAAE